MQITGQNWKNMIPRFPRGTVLPDSPGIDVIAGRTCLNSRRFSEKKAHPGEEEQNRDAPKNSPGAHARGF